MATHIDQALGWLRDFKSTWLPEQISHDTSLREAIGTKLDELEHLLIRKKRQFVWESRCSLTCPSRKWSRNQSTTNRRNLSSRQCDTIGDNHHSAIAWAIFADATRALPRPRRRAKPAGTTLPTVDSYQTYFTGGGREFSPVSVDNR